MSSVSCVASTAPWPARAWSEWPCVISALLDRPRRIDMKAAGLAAHAGRRSGPGCLQGASAARYAYRAHWLEPIEARRMADVRTPVRLLRRSDRRPALRMGARACGARRSGGGRRSAGAGAGTGAGFASAWFALGEMRDRLGDRDGAVAAFAQARAADPDGSARRARCSSRGSARAGRRRCRTAYVRTLFDHMRRASTAR